VRPVCKRGAGEAMSSLSSNPLPICPKCNKPMPFLSESAGMPKVERFNCKACKVLCRIEMEFDYYGESTTVEPETECGACDKPGEHCARPYGICVRHCKPKARDEQEDAYNAAARVMADKASTVSPPSADIEALLESFVWAVRRDNDNGDQYTRQEVKDLRAELLAAIRAVQPPSADAARLRAYFDNANCISHPSLFYSSANPFTDWCEAIDWYVNERAAVTKSAAPDRKCIKCGVGLPPHWSWSICHVCPQ
jgi:hypothetical protein